MLRILGIDPGINCGIALLTGERGNQLEYLDHAPLLKEGKQRSINGPRLAEIFADLDPDIAVIEKVHAMPGQGVTSMFRFGRAVGTLEGLLSCLKVRLSYVSPQQWKRHFNLKADKEAARAAAVRMFPSHASALARRKDVDRAEAVLIARWFFDTDLGVVFPRKRNEDG